MPRAAARRGLRGHASAGASTGHGALLAGLCCTAILIVSAVPASWPSRHRAAR